MRRQEMYFIYVNYKGDRNKSQVVDYISSQDGGKTFYHGLVEDRSNALMFTVEEIDAAVKRAKADFGNSYTVKKEYAGYKLNR